MTVNREEKEMLDYLGMDSIERLFDDIPGEVKTNGLDLPKGLSEMDTKRLVEAKLSRNISLDEVPSFLGSGTYDYYIPASVGAILGRSEFYSSYTPYQPETSQGMLQSMFEYQSMMSELTGMEVVNNSMYDWATALGEAVLMSSRIKKGGQFLVPRAMKASRSAVLRNYVRGACVEIVEVDFDENTGQLDMADLGKKMNDDTIGLYIETPNLFGIFEEGMDDMRNAMSDKMLVAGVDPISLAITRPPGEYGAGIVIGDGQSLGNPVNFGGPHLGFFACKKKYVRKMPGRIVGVSHDAEGQQAYCMTLQTREQHIRREKATSNICSNEALTTLAAAVYMALMGGQGLEILAIDTMEKTGHLARKLSGIGIETHFKGYHFNEITVRFPIPAKDVFDSLATMDIIGGKALDLPGMENCMVMAVTDKTTDGDMETLIQALGQILGAGQ